MLSICWSVEGDDRIDDEQRRARQGRGEIEPVDIHHAYGGAWGVVIGRTAVVLTGYMLVITAAAALSVAVYAASH